MKSIKGKQSILSLLVFLLLFAQAFAQQDTDEDNPSSNHNLLFQPVVYQEKSASKAMIMSALIPGAGQFYVSKKSPTAYLFPIIEIGLWIAMINYYNKGDDVTTKYNKFVDTHYDRARQEAAQEHFKATATWGDFENHFRLDPTNTQHFYEDVGKYNKYIFGWSDWFDNYVDYSHDGVNYNVHNIYWAFEDRFWVGNRPISNPSQASYDEPYSELRAEYIVMRHKAEDHYSNSRAMNYCILLNHALATADAYRLASKYNQRIKTASISPEIRTAVIENRIVPMLNLNVNF